ncbi:hypothetical protein NDU88_006454 [Pleurodeles waltl]|uniref:Reverse transcriptase/retrotransposon-derived protein RNase H-like domain-containing protein n=1 Tax=Pleurodeles waltl TaxID=8319 RepID=A0AAV7WCK8_PLEWA|nr:hypothetical protein NDU88_006454 [Pleurodeles waltl]
MSPPKTRKEVKKFLGMVSYCRQWIPNFSTLAKPLLKLTQKDAQDEIVLKRDEMDAFVELKERMCRAPALGMPDYTKPFTLFCHERDACSLSVLSQAHGGVNRPVAYFSATLDPVAAALPGCLRAVAAVGISLNQSEGIVMGHPLTVMVPHSVEILLTGSRTQHMTGARLTRYETIILGSPNVKLKRCTTLNPATLFPSENVEIENAEDIEHDCLQPESEQEEIGTEEIFSEEDEVVPFEEKGEEASGGDKDPISSEEAGEPDKRRAFSEAVETGKEGENLIDLLEEGDKAEQIEIVPNLPEPVAGPSGENNTKRRQSISKTKETLNENKWPKLKEKRKEVSITTTSNEEQDTAKDQDISERESKGDAKLKRKRIPSRRYSGPEWAYTATNDWSDEFLSLSLENEEAEQHFGT